ncbi:NAD-dependent epimerase/dehydratase family protein [Bosea sp. LjRoot9]|uniref:NAD-dependent epimerase/dehydratase family protein n=1 Tax=Bosea sp. LjRoot9 TaxID=3342341 RepID=UPI003ED0EFEE
MSRRAFIIGGTGQIGRAVADELLAHGWEVVLSHRGHRLLPEEMAARGAKLAVLDRDEPGALARALAAGADAVIDTIAYSDVHADQLLEIERATGAFVVISSCSVYRDAAGRTLDEARTGGFPDLPLAMSEDQPTVDPGPKTYSTRKVALERRLLDHARRPVTVLRPCAIHGRHSVHPREWWFVKRMLDGRDVIPLAYRGESRFHTSAVVNIAALVRRVLEVPGTRILNAADPSTPSVAEIAATIASHLDYRGRLLPVDDDSYPPLIGATPWSVPAPFTLDTGAALALGYRPVATYREASKTACDWLVKTAPSNWREAFPVLASYSRDLFDYAGEDAYFERVAQGRP